MSTLTYNVLPPKLDLSIKQIIKKEGFIQYEINNKSICTNGGNFLSDLFEIDIKGRTTDGYKTLNIFVKYTIDTSSFFEILSLKDAYAIEAFAYKELFNVYTELQEKASVPIEERFKMIMGYAESDCEAIIMENMAKKGYAPYSRMSVMPLKFLEKCVLQLARLHALSFVLKEERPKYFEEKIKTIKCGFIIEEGWQQMVDTMKEVAINNVEDNLKDKVDKAYREVLIKFGSYCNDDSIQVCLCHGDYRANNIMVKMEADEIQEIVPVDYQLMYYGCPVFDFLYLITNCTDRDARRKHTSNLKDLYFATFGKFLKYFDLEAEVLYSREKFERVYKEKLDYGLMTALLFLPFHLASDEVPEFDQEKLRVDPSYKERLSGIIEDYVEWGYL